MTLDLTSLTIAKSKELVQSKQLSLTELANAYLKRIDKINPKINAFLTVCRDEAINQAKLLDQKISSGQPLGRLVGAMMAVKDVFLTKGIPTTAGSKVLEGYLPQYSATVYRRLIEEDAVVLGKTNTDCFAFGASTENSGFFTTKNPWDPDLVPGGSSGGSAAAQSASLCTFALGTDTGGSIRQPASLCGVTGIKPTYGRNSRYGITAMASSFDCPGAFAKNAKDLALIAEIMAGADPHDATSSPSPVPNYHEMIDRLPIKGVKIGLPKEYFSGSIDPDVKSSVLAAAKVYEDHGANIIDISLPSTHLGVAVYYVLVPAEISSNMARYDGLRFGRSKQNTSDLLSYYLETRGEYMEPEIKRRVIIGTYALSAGYFDAYYTKASKVRTLIRQEFADSFNSVDLILAPVSPTPAWPIGQKAADPLQMYLADVYTCCINVAGLPAVALPCCPTPKGLPVGFQLIGNYFEESKLFSFANHYQQLTDYHLLYPQI